MNDSFFIVLPYLGRMLVVQSY